jgi:hypothetical protein
MTPYEQEAIRTPESDGAGESAQIDGAADTGPGTKPEGATPKVSKKSGDPLADAHDSHGR